MKLVRSFIYAGNGIKYCFKNEPNFRIHLLAIIVVIIMSCFFRISSTEWFFVIGCCTIVTSVEMLNTAMEKMCDLISKESHPLIKVAKDAGAGAVLICAAGSALIGVIIFLPKIIHLLKLF